MNALQATPSMSLNPPITLARPAPDLRFALKHSLPPYQHMVPVLTRLVPYSIESDYEHCAYLSALEYMLSGDEH